MKVVEGKRNRRVWYCKLATFSYTGSGKTVLVCHPLQLCNSGFFFMVVCHYYVGENLPC